MLIIIFLHVLKTEDSYLSKKKQYMEKFKEKVSKHYKHKTFHVFLLALIKMRALTYPEGLVWISETVD